MPRRPPLLWLALISLVAALGLGSRRYAGALPPFVAAYAGDTLWALAAFLGVGLLRPRASTGRVAALALAFAVLVEVSQLYHVPWLDALRRTRPGALVLGAGFLWSDLACYAAGVALGALGEWLARRGRFNPVPDPPPARHGAAPGPRAPR